MENGIFKPTSIGTPQGGVISPLLANIVLNKLDWRLEQAGIASCDMRMTSSLSVKRGSRPTQP